MMLNLLFAAFLATPHPSIDLPIERYTLSNGLAVILHEDHRVPSVTVNLWFHVGSADEAVGRTGFAHLFEHLMFMGTAEVPNGGFDQVMEQAGGFNNASTSFDRTNYFESGPSNLLETFLFLESDRLAHLADDMTKKKLDLQRDVVKNERRQSYENRPYGLTELILFEKLFPPNHPYHHTPIGSHQDLSAAQVADVKAFFRRFYVPANASVVIAGDFKPSQARALVEQYFSPLQRMEPPPRVLPPATSLKAPVRVTQKDKVQAERVVLGYLAPGKWSPGDAESQLLATVLGVGKSSRLVNSLVLEQQLASELDVDLERLPGASVFIITATAQQGHSGAELEKALDREIARLSDHPPTDEEVTRARSLLQVEGLTQLEQPFMRADALNELQSDLGDPSLLPHTLLKRFEIASASDVAEVARRILGQPRLTLTFVPETVTEKRGAK